MIDDETSEIQTIVETINVINAYFNEPTQTIGDRIITVHFERKVRRSGIFMLASLVVQM